MPAMTVAQLRDPEWRRLLALHFGWTRSLSPALEGDLAAFCGAPDFARALERVGEVEQGGPALPFALGDQFFAPHAQGLGFEGIGRAAEAVRAFGFHAPKLRASVVARQCDASPVSHPENVQ